jgi:hypothetical protein
MSIWWFNFLWVTEILWLVNILRYFIGMIFDNNIFTLINNIQGLASHFTLSICIIWISFLILIITLSTFFYFPLLFLLFLLLFFLKSLFIHLLIFFNLFIRQRLNFRSLFIYFPSKISFSQRRSIYITVIFIWIACISASKKSTNLLTKSSHFLFWLLIFFYVFRDNIVISLLKDNAILHNLRVLHCWNWI